MKLFQGSTNMTKYVFEETFFEDYNKTKRHSHHQTLTMSIHVINKLLMIKIV